jgi:hypothetical protein
VKTAVIVRRTVLLLGGGVFVAAIAWMLLPSEYGGRVYTALVPVSWRTSCYGISDVEAKARIDVALAHDREMSANGLVLGRFRSDQVKLVGIERTPGKRGDGDFSVELKFRNKATDTNAFSAVVYETCEIQWIIPNSW